MRSLVKRDIAAVAIALIALIAHAAEPDSEDKRRADVIRFGLENEITELVSSIDKDDVSLTEDLAALFSKTRSPAVRESILALFAKQGNRSLADYALSVLEDPYDAKKTTVSAVFNYAETLHISEAAPAARGMLEREDSVWRSDAIRLLGKVGAPEDARFLIDYLDGEISGDEKQRLIIRQEVMTALGSLKAIEVWDRMADIARDENENAFIRATSARALGLMGKGEAIPLLAALYEDQDPLLRAAAVEALGGLSGSEAESVVAEAFRDTNYKVRLAALGAAERQRYSGVGATILYRARTDPVEAVKWRAFEVLGSLGEAEGLSWLESIAVDEKASDKMRLKAMSVLFDKSQSQFGPSLAKIAFASLKDDKKAVLRNELGKILSKGKTEGFGDLAVAYIQHKDPQAKALGLEMYNKSRYAEALPFVEAIAADPKMGGLQSRAKAILAK
jgi:HEAT repeat protein